VAVIGARINYLPPDAILLSEMMLLSEADDDAKKADDVVKRADDVAKRDR
jgi:hypothetical protein